MLATMKLTDLDVDDLSGYLCETQHFDQEVVVGTTYRCGLSSGVLVCKEADFEKTYRYPVSYTHLTINEYAPGLLDSEIGNIGNRILDMRLCDLAEKGSANVDRMLDMLTQLCVCLLYTSMYTNRGENHLGQLLMKLRLELQCETERDMQ